VPVEREGREPRTGHNRAGHARAPLAVERREQARGAALATGVAGQYSEMLPRQKDVTYYGQLEQGARVRRVRGGATAWS
jgi:transposase